jgi:hypothetical protein
MKKIRLRIDGLAVESFPTAPDPVKEAGTVHGAEGTLRTAQCGTCAGYTCEGASCFTSCIPGGPNCTCPVA